MDIGVFDLLLGALALVLVLAAVRRVPSVVPSLRVLLLVLPLQFVLIPVTFWFYDVRFTASPPAPDDWILPAVLNLVYLAVRVALAVWLLRYWFALGAAERPRRAFTAVIAWFFCVYIGNLPAGVLAAIASIAATNRDRVDNLEGPARFGVLLVSVLSILLLMPLAHEPIVLDVFDLGAVDGVAHTSQYNLSAAAPESVRWLAFAARPFAQTLLVITSLLWFANVSLFVRLVVPRIYLKKLRLNPRFNLIYVLLLPVPGILLLASLVAALYYGAGMNKVSILVNLIEERIEEVERSLEFPATALRRGEAPDAALADWESAREREDAFFARDGEALVAASGFVAAPLEWEPLLPDTLDRVGGLYYRSGALWLGAARRVDSVRAVEAYRPVDVAFLTRLANRVSADLEIVTRTDLQISSSGLRFGTNHWAHEVFAVRTVEYDTTQGRFWNAANTYLPIGDWLHPFEGSRGGVALSVQTEPRRILVDWLGGGSVFYRAGPLIGTMLLIGILLAVAVNVAVGIGRGLVRGVLTDLARLTEGVERFGRGDLDSRVRLEGEDEVAALAQSFNDMAENIRENQAELLEKERLEADLAVAREIQARLLPQSAPVLGSLDVAGISIPSREVGGDLFSYLHLPTGHLGVAIGDVSGKSVPAALLMSNVLAALRSEANHTEHANESMGNMNRIVSDQVEDQFVTFFYGVIDPRTGRMLYACAGHNPSLVVGADGSRRWLSEAGLPLGVMPDSKYELYEDRLAPGDILVLYSDGVTEACDEAIAVEDEDELEFYGEDRLVDAVVAHRGESAAAIMHGVLEDMRAFTHGAAQSDDVTLVIVKYTPASGAER